MLSEGLRSSPLCLRGLRAEVEAGRQRRRCRSREAWALTRRKGHIWIRPLLEHPWPVSDALTTVLSLVCGAMIAPMEGVYEDQEGHTSSASSGHCLEAV
jgi:hypothetical protein